MSEDSLLTAADVQKCLDPQVPSGCIEILCDGPPGPESGTFVEVEDGTGSINVGKWVRRSDGIWALRIDLDAVAKTIKEREVEVCNHGCTMPLRGASWCYRCGSIGIHVSGEAARWRKPER